MLHLDDRFYIKQNGDNIILVELVDSMSIPKDGSKPKPIKTEKARYFGTVYQALQGYLNYSLNSSSTLTDVRKKAVSIITVIDKFESEIKEKFRCEVKTSK